MTAIANRAAALPIRNREPFVNHTGSFTGLHHATRGFGILPYKYHNALMDARTAPGFYIVYSYQTPIAWYDDVAGWTVPDVKYSVTTSRHQSAVRVGISAPATYFDQFKTEVAR